MANSPYTVVVFSQSTGNVVPNAPVKIYNRNTNGTSGSLAVIYSDEAGASPISQPGATANAQGVFVFYADGKAYNAEYEGFTQPIDVGITETKVPNAIGGVAPYEFDTVANAKTGTLIGGKTVTPEVGDVAVIKELRGAKYDIVLTSTVAPNDTDVIQFTSTPTLSMSLITRSTMHVAEFNVDTTGAIDHTSRINTAIAKLGDGSTLDFRGGSYKLSGIAGTSPNDFAVADGQAQPDAPANSAISVRGRENITLLVDGASFTTSDLNSFQICLYKCTGCKVVGNAKYNNTGTIATEQPSAVTMVRCLDCHLEGGSVQNHYRSVFLLKSALCSVEKVNCRASVYFSIYISGTLDVPVGWSSSVNNLDFTNWCEGCSVTGSKTGSYFLEYATATNCYAYDGDNSAGQVLHFSSQQGPYRAYDCHVIEGSNQNSGNVINGFSISPTQSLASSQPVSGTVLSGCTTKGCRKGFVGNGFRDVSIINCTATDYYMTGFSFVSVKSGGVDFIVEGLMLDNIKALNINSASTLVNVGNEKLAGLQLEKNDGASFDGVVVSGGTFNLDKKGSITPGGTAYEMYAEDVANLVAADYLVEGTRGVVGFNKQLQSGTVMPTIEFGGTAAAGYTRSNLDYKIDNGVCSFYINIKLQSKGAGTGDAEIVTNIPVQPKLSDSNMFVPLSAFGFGWASAPSNMTALVNPASGRIQLYTDNNVITKITHSEFDNLTEIYFSGSYPV